MTWSRETVYQVWDDNNGERYEVCQDPDGLGCCELRYVNEQGKIQSRLTMPIEAAVLLRDAITDFLKAHGK